MQNNLTELEKLLYNKHLAVSRSLKNKPFKFKKTFDDIANTDRHKYLVRLSVLFKKHPEIDPTVFFEAPYKLYPDVEYFGLDYFSTMRAVKAYTTYKKSIFLQDPDNQLEEIKRSLEFIVKFCVSSKIYLHQYPFHRKSDIYTWMTHYKENKINIYSVMEFSDVFSSVQNLAEDVQKFFLSDFINQFKNLYMLYAKSRVLKPYMQKAIPQLNNFINKELTNQKHNVE
jgi:hypothetical protein